MQPPCWTRSADVAAATTSARVAAWAKVRLDAARHRVERAQNDAVAGLVRGLAARGVRRRYRSDEALFVEGDISDRVSPSRKWSGQGDMPLAGRARRAAGNPNSRRHPRRASSLDHSPRSASATALEPVETIVVGARDLDRALAESPEAARELLSILATRLRDADRKRVEFATLDTLGRVAVRLLELCERFGQSTADGVLISLPISQEELAGWCGASREATVKALRTLRELGRVTTGRNKLVVHDLQALRRHAGLPSS